MQCHLISEIAISISILVLRFIPTSYELCVFCEYHCNVVDWTSCSALVAPSRNKVRAAEEPLGKEPKENH